MFEPIAIIGQACLLPGAHTPEALWQNSITDQDCLTDATLEQWGIDPDTILNTPIDGTWTKRCGTVAGFSSQFDPHGFFLDAEHILTLDVLQQWLLHTGRQALNDAKLTLENMPSLRSGAIIGNLSYPTQSFVHYAETIWLRSQGLSSPRLSPVSAENRFMSGLPIFRLAEALGLKGPAYAIDAACASSVYAIKLACDQLQSHQADVMIAGGINAADSLFLQMGFSALHALSKQGQSLPLHRDADGLVPSQGVALVVLKRLHDAIQANDFIYGVVRGIGLSNDGRGSGLLVPHGPGQVAAMRQAYDMSGLSPDDVDWVACHATGTPLGDTTEIRSMQQLFTAKERPALGALKANIGHTITASGAAALIHVLSAFAHQQKPKTRLSADVPAGILQETGFHLLKEMEAWAPRANRPRLAAINCFGFGGNNAHLLVEDWHASYLAHYFLSPPRPSAFTGSPIAIVGMGVLAANANDKTEWAATLWGDCPELTSLGAFVSDVDLSIEETPFPPRDLQHTLGQQLAVVKAAQNALASVKNVSQNRTAVYIGMQCDAEIARSGLRWRLSHLLPDIKDPAWLQAARDQIQPPIEAADIIGCMPNIVTNRLNNLFDFKAPSFSVSAEELSGTVALELAIDQLQKKEIDMAVIGAVDMNCESVHQAAAAAVLQSYQQVSGDAALVLVLKRLQDAKKDGDTIESILPADYQTVRRTASTQMSNTSSFITERMGHVHAACGLLHVAAASMACSHVKDGVQLHLTALGHQQKSIYLQNYARPQLAVFSGEDHDALLAAIQRGEMSTAGRSKLVVVAHHAEEFEQQKQRALAELQTHRDVSSPGLFYFEKPVSGQLAFVFTGALTSYANMGAELIQAWPELMDGLQEEVTTLSQITDQIYKMQGNSASLSMLDELKTYSFLTQLHARFSHHVLKLVPDACIGYCSGETNALIAMRAWRDMEKLFLDVESTGLYTQKLGGDYKVLTENGKEPKWSTWRVFSPVETVKNLLTTVDDVRLTIINSPDDCIIAGHPAACEAFLKKLNSPKTKELPHSLLIHCPEFAPYAEEWRQLHYRTTYPVPDVHFYSGGRGKRYEATAENASDALLSQAADTVDFPRVVKQAWQDGVRLFVELGPRDICSEWIRSILGDKEHLTVSFDKMGTSSLTQSVYAIAKLVAAGVTQFDYSPFLLKDGVW